MDIEIPHDLGAAEARRRIENGLPKLEQHIPGGGSLDAEWKTETELAMEIKAMGQKVPVIIHVLDDRLDTHVTIPPFLKMMSGQIGDFVRLSAEKMLASG
ncbi:polyhydroxyalkanoic acid system family protein [Croceicoccus mobilis]|uniref:Polyhydroxyalkanoic acid system protein n=1 Tax=Croceicoccus mobilis TaxID=1703339 RepID=A0A916Z4E1_9SPHN|nr:polyhydroxyalkanoic acid system family protein [Croceicoccus mobilis]GGD75890.1 polyhydroxyalkanoic acid system protein [Croceicoccus mobilis]